MDTQRFDARVSSFYISLSVAVNAMAKRTSRKSAKVAKKAAAKRVDATAAKPRETALNKTAPKSQARKVAKPALLAGGNEVRQSGFLPKHVTASSPPGRVQAQGSTLP